MCPQADDPDSAPVLDILGIEVLPTVQFWRDGKLLWEHRGVNQLEQNMGEGVLYFGDRCGGVMSMSCFCDPQRTQGVFHSDLALHE
jgi:hypothetical protein